jgi:hypothetical protein
MKISCLIISLLMLGFSGIYSEELKVLYPNGGEKIKTGTNIQIKWKSSEKSGKIIIILYKKGIKHSVISEQAENNGLYLWKVPHKMEKGRDYRIRIRLAKNLSVNDFSDQNFTIKK